LADYYFTKQVPHRARTTLLHIYVGCRESRDVGPLISVIVFYSIESLQASGSQKHAQVPHDAPQTAVRFPLFYLSLDSGGGVTEVAVVDDGHSSMSLLGPSYILVFTRRLVKIESVLALRWVGCVAIFLLLPSPSPSSSSSSAISCRNGFEVAGSVRDE